ncbi:LysR family transcriptional regulator [Bradyrhizobium liaoningense]|uniref:LysR family transcriptional regulator n=1 Tax=Bradyrhizobium liaoningense TaxID=43992 RepID=UPI001FE37E9E|nr:LysR family transcriptional regulator [Bradyrhizobium liaoningense]
MNAEHGPGRPVDDTDLADIDLGLLLALEALLRERNVTRAALRLNIGQPALSARLNRLRQVFADPLFVPAAAGRGVVPTTRATELQTELADVLGKLRRMVEGPAVFDPARSQRTFVVAIHENPAVTLAPGFVARLTATAAQARLAFVHPTRDIVERLERGEIDILVTGADRAHGELMQRPLFEDSFLSAQRKGHPRGNGALDLDRFCALDHLLISADGGGFSGLVDDALAALGRSRRVAVSIQTYALAPVILAHSDCICTLPRRFLMRFAHELDLTPPPLDLPLARIVALWHPRNQEDGAHAWLRDCLYQAAAAPRA